MSARQKEKRSRRFYGVLSDPWRKLVSIGLAILLWQYLHARITKSLADDLPLLFNEAVLSQNHVAVQLNSTEYSIRRFVDGDNPANPIAKVTIEMEGPNNLIQDLKKSGEMAFEVKLSAADVNPGTPPNPPFVVFELDDVRHRIDPEYNRIRKRMTPRRVRVELRRNASKLLPLSAKNVAIEVSGGDDSVASRVSEPTFNPPSVTLFGAKDLLDGIDAETKLFRATLTARDIEDKTSVIKQLGLAPEFADRGFKLTMPSVTYKVEPERDIFQLVDVPVLFDTTEAGDAARDRFSVEPTKVTIKIRVALKSRLAEELNQYFAVGMPVSVVRPEWTLEHTRFRVVLKKADLAATETIERQPTLRLFTLDSKDQESLFALGPDYLMQDDVPFIKIKPRKKND